MKKTSLIIFIVIVSLLIISIFTMGVIVNTRHHHEFVEVDNEIRQVYINYLNKQCTFQKYTATRSQARASLEAEFNFDNYTYKEGKVKNGMGLSIIPIRYIKVDVAADDMEYYYIVLAHEMCHIKYFTTNEIYTQFMAFKGLYESDNDELKQAGIWLGIYILNRGYSEDYDCSNLIINYLKEI